jgi:hypothetical protein
MMTNIRVKHRDRKILSLWTIKHMSTEKLQPTRLWSTVCQDRKCSGCLGCDSKPSPGDSKHTVIPWSDVGCLFPSRSPTGTKAVSVRSASRLDWLSLRPLHCHVTGLPRFRGQDLLNPFPCQGPPFRSITPRRGSSTLCTSNQTELAQVDMSTSRRGQRTCMS